VCVCVLCVCVRVVVRTYRSCRSCMLASCMCVIAILRLWRALLLLTHAHSGPMRGARVNACCVCARTTNTLTC
jgi:hypothetical protein